MLNISRKRKVQELKNVGKKSRNLCNSAWQETSSSSHETSTSAQNIRENTLHSSSNIIPLGNT